jgi:hypothetical protein
MFWKLLLGGSVGGESSDPSGSHQLKGDEGVRSGSVARPPPWCP